MGTGCSSDTGGGVTSGNIPTNRSSRNRNEASEEEYLNIVDVNSPVIGPEPAPERNEPDSTPNGIVRELPDGDSDTLRNEERSIVPLSEPTTASPPKPVKQTEVKSFDAMIADNRKHHQTALYAHPGLIIRRGQPFDLQIGFNKTWDKSKDIVRVQLAMGKRPKINRGTMFFITPGKANDAKAACAVITNVKNDANKSVITLRVNLPCDAVIGYYKLFIVFKKLEDTTYKKYNYTEEVIVLFNPWLKEDQVYVKDDDERYEYVMNESGRIFSGKYSKISSKPWLFGQFSEGVLDTAIYLLDSDRSLNWEAYCDPVMVTRTLSAQVNSSDGSGVLSGNWSGDYSGGVAPTQWVSSVQILQQYKKTKEAVKWGQCWVFSGLTTTVCRALGIPTRSVTNFASAHDNDYSISIDNFYDEKGEYIRHLSDSIWNFHVWNEAWFRRPDIPGGYDGWQAFDSTPQEQSEGVFRCGPTPVKAIKNGEVHIGFDTRFFFATVNGDVITWVKKADGTQIPTKKDTNSVGKNISTKKVNNKTDLNDVTNQYKFSEGSAEERAAVQKAYQQSDRREEYIKYYNLDEKYDVEMSFSAHMDRDATASFKFLAVNKSKSVRTVTVTVHAVPKYYTGVAGKDLFSEVKTFEIEPGKDKIYENKLTAADWINQIAEDAALGIHVMAVVKETKQYFTWQSDEDSDIELDKPEIDMKLNKESAKVGEKVQLTMSFTNPINLDLKECSIMIDGVGVLETMEVAISNVPANGKMSKTVTLTVIRAEKLEVVAVFHSRQLVNITGTVDIEGTE